MTPLSIRTERGAVESGSFSVGDAVEARDGFLLANERAFQISGAKEWSSFLPVTDSGEARKRLLCRAVQRTLARRCPRSSFGTLPSGPVQAGCAGEAELIAARRVCRARRLAARKDSEGAMREIAGLLGLGIGLTPAGDDFLLGMLAGLHVRQREQEAGHLYGALRGQVLQGVSKTTELSGAFLKAACQGNFAEPIHRLFMAAGQAEADEAADAAANAGHTSGTDLLGGIDLVCRITASPACPEAAEEDGARGMGD